MDEKISSGELFGISKEKSEELRTKVFSEFLKRDSVLVIAKRLGFTKSKNEELFCAFLFGKLVEKNNNL